MNAACLDCDLPYTDRGWVDCALPDDVWARISLTGGEGGLLCLTCMTARLVDEGLGNVPLLVTSGPYSHAPNEAFQKGFSRGDAHGFTNLTLQTVYEVLYDRGINPRLSDGRLLQDVCLDALARPGALTSTDGER